jgi:hypothetical protein
MTTSQVFHLISGFEPFLAISALNTLLAIWILIRIKRNHRDIAAIKNLCDGMRPHEVAMFKPVASLNEQDVHLRPQALNLGAFAGNTSNSKIDGFIKALKEGTDLDEAAKQFHLTEDEASVAMVSYRAARVSKEKSDPIF